MRSEDCGGSSQDDDDLLGSPGSPNKELTEEEKKELRSHRLQKVGEEFYNCVEVAKVAKALNLPEEMVEFVYNYWALKRKSQFNKPLLTPKTEEEDLLSKQQEDSLLARMKMFVRLRQDLERVRNLCYMVTKREKMRRRLYQMKEDIFFKQVVMVGGIKDTPKNLSDRDFTLVLNAHKLPTESNVYDQYDDILRMANLDTPEELNKPIEHDLTNIRVKREYHGGRSRKDSVSQSDHQQSDSPCVVKSEKHNYTSGSLKDRRDSRKSTPEPTLRRLSLRDRDRDKPRRETKTEMETEKGDKEKCEATKLIKNEKLIPEKNEPKCEKVKFTSKNLEPTEKLSATKSEDVKVSKKTENVKVESLKSEVNPAYEVSDSKDETIPSGRALRSLRSDPKNIVTGNQHKVIGEIDNLLVDVTSVESVRRERQERLQERHSPRSADPAPNLHCNRIDGKNQASVLPQTDLESSKAEKVMPSKREFRVKTKANNAVERGESNKFIKGTVRKDLSSRDRSSLGELPSYHRSSTDTIDRPKRRSEVNGIMPDSQFLVSQSVKDKVHRRLNVVNSRRNVSASSLRHSNSHYISSLSIEGKDENLSPVKDRLRSESSKVRETMFAASPKSSFSGYRIPRKSPVKLEDNSGESTPLKRSPEEQLGTPETRSRRRKITSDIESNTSDRLYDTFDGEISIRSSRSTTPDHEYSHRTTRHLHKQLNLKLKAEVALRSETPSEMSDDQSVGDVIDDSEFHMSDTGSDNSGYGQRITRSRRIDNMDTLSVESGASSGSKYSTRSRNMNEHWSRVLNTLHS